MTTGGGTERPESPGRPSYGGGPPGPQGGGPGGPGGPTGGGPGGPGGGGPRPTGPHQMQPARNAVARSRITNRARDDFFMPVLLRSVLKAILCRREPPPRSRRSHPPWRHLPMENTLVPGERIELSRPFGHGILSPVRLPIPPPGRLPEPYHKTGIVPRIRGNPYRLLRVGEMPERRIPGGRLPMRTVPAAWRRDFQEKKEK